jgi:hypothetical protein
MAPQLSSKQSFFIASTQIAIITFCVIGIASCVYFFPSFMDTRHDIMTKLRWDQFNNYTHSLENYFKNGGGKISTDCFEFDGRSFTIKAPITLTDKALQKTQFRNGIKLKGMDVMPTQIQISNKLLFSNNMNQIASLAPGNTTTSALNSAFGSHFFGTSGKTEIGLSITESDCPSQAAQAGSFSNPFPAMYVKSNQICLCLSNWLFRYNSHTPGTYTYALTGNQAYDSPGEYCSPIS